MLGKNGGINMANYDITQKDIALLSYPKLIHVKVYLLDSDNYIVDELQGYVTEGSGSDDATADVRKTCNFTLHSYDKTYDVDEYNRIWLNQRVRIDIGYEYCNEIMYYTKGTYVFDSCSYTYDGSTRDIQFQCSDLVNTMNGTHSGIVLGECPYCDKPLYECGEHRGQFFSETIIIEGCNLNEETGLYEGNDIKKTVEDLLEQFGITEYRIDTIGQVSCLQGYVSNWKQNRMDTGTTEEEANEAEKNGIDDLANDHGTWHMIPYDLEFSTEVTLWEILTKIRDLYSGYEMFFDKDGMFVFQLIPTCQDDMNILDHTQFEGLVISENTDLDLTTVRNATYVYGQSIETDRYTDNCSIESVQYNNKSVTAIKPTFDLPFVYKSNIVIGITIPEVNQSNLNKSAYLTLNNEVYRLTKRSVTTELDEAENAISVVNYEDMKYSAFNNDDMYCFKWLNNQKLWTYVGMYQIEGYYENNDENSPFAIGKIGYRLQILSGGDYDNITTSELANERAEYENWLVSRLTDTITLETVIIPFLEVNQKIEYKKLSDGSIDSYIIKSLSYSFTDGTMTITMTKFYELDPFIVRS